VILWSLPKQQELAARQHADMVECIAKGNHVMAVVMQEQSALNYARARRRLHYMRNIDVAYDVANSGG
jgi:hypothetical protein